MTPEQAAALRAPFPSSQIGQLPRGGIMLDYVGHAATTDRLLQVDPEWTWEPAAVGPNGEPLIVDGGLWIKLTVAGVTRYGYGDGPSVKEMIGDAIRNAAMRFGVALDLWARDGLGQPQQETPVALPDDGKRTSAQNKNLHRILGELDSSQPRQEGDWKDYARQWTQDRFGKHSSADLTEAECRDLIAHLEALEIPFG